MTIPRKIHLELNALITSECEHLQVVWVYILDEPEAALSPTRQLSVLSRMHQLVKANSQFIIATHSPILMAYPGARIYQIDQSGINQIKYEDTEHYQVTKAFLNNPAPMLAQLFSD
ncbi:AAA family ATPase [Enterovibrio norvegicus]|uniref:AAA ATPase domain-containing protein n=1 Tax=Enterovibrio norvegicus DSM 15893 TaxID=1121869 RepID=A0A1I5SQT2_9GAMM|nr:AAA family ATPase [Enterovibrio norvegicus]MCC4797605.1 AAA family ATPase [Enterovibrio norvegicus]TKF11917.1 hypothetical protein FCV66_16890 [Enterovibrio norvegicus]TKF28671.1 hypothetical protein FCV83_22560 [Enterovibrio norvegicus]SFP73093.1 AAA ATPase domain-containing protein [Enterovibrio norvegicus DSM 15893]